MKKVLKFRQNNKLTEAAFLNINDAKLANRARDLARLAKKSREAAKKAEQQQKIDLMNKLNKQAEDIDEVIKGIYQDSIDKASGEQPSINNNSSKQVEDQKASQSEIANQEQENSAEEEPEQENGQEVSKEKSKTDSSAENKNANPTESEKDEQQNSSKSSSSKEDSGEDSEGKSQGESDDEGDEGDDGNDSEDEGDEGSEGESEEESGDEGDSEEEEGSDEGEGDSEDNEDSDGDGESEDESEEGEGTGDDQEEESEGSEGDEEDSEGSEQESEEDDSDDSDGSDESEEEQKKEKQSKGGGGSSGEESEEESEDESEEDSEGDDSDGDSESEPVIDPFADEEDIPQFPQGGGGGEEPREADLDDIIKMLKGLKGRAKEGAISGVQNILDNKYGVTESLTEAAKNIRKMDDEEFGDYVNELVDLIQQADDLEEVSDIEDRLNKIDKMKNNPATQRAIQADDTVALRKDYVAKKAREAENAKYQNYPTIKQFEIDFYETIKAQVDKVKQTIQSYDEINNEYESENIIMKADVDREIPEESKPIIDFYFDCSGSWTKHSDAVEIGKRAVATVQEFADRGEIKLNVYYFGRNDLSTNMNDVWGGGTECWDAIIQNIKATKAKNVVLMTDCDMLGQAANGPTCVVEGCVWFIWSLYDYTRGSKQIVKHLKGMEGQAQFAFGSGGMRDPATYGDND